MEPPEDIRALSKEEHRDELARRLELARTHSRSGSVTVPEDEDTTGLLASAFAQQSVCNPETHYQPVTDFQEKPEMGAVGASRPFSSPHQRFVVYTVSHVGMPPRVTVPIDARLRLYGVFADDAEARAYAEEVMAVDETVNIQIAPTQQWIVAVSHLDKLTAEYMDPKREAMLRDHEATLHAEEARFRRRLRGEEEEEATTVEPPTVEAAKPQCKAAPPPGAPVRFPRHLEIREQGYAIVSFIKDTGPPHEFAFNVWAVTETVEEASNYIRGVAGERVKDHTMIVCGLYAWLSPFAATEGVPVTHRASELNGIVRAAERSQSQVESFRRWCHESDQEAPIIDLT